MPALSHITKLFPPPRYMRLPSAGIDISDTSLKYLQFEEAGSELKLVHWGDIDIPEGVVSRGDVKEKEKLVEVLKKARTACRAEYVRVSLPEERAYLFETTIKRGTEFKDIRGMLEFRLEENVPLSPRDAFFDYDIVEDATDEEGFRVSVAVYARETVVNYYEACRAAGLMPISFEVEAQAIAKAAIRAGDEHTHLIVDFGKTRTGVGIVSRGVLMYTSTIDIGGRELSGALRQEFGELAEEELTKMKNTKGLMHTGEAKEVYGALLPIMTKLTNELAARINYWNSDLPDHQKERNIQSIILCGGSVNLAGLPAYLTEELGVEARRADVWQNAFSLDEHIPPILKRYSYGYATAIGLALRGFLA